MSKDGHTIGVCGDRSSAFYAAFHTSRTEHLYDLYDLYDVDNSGKIHFMVCMIYFMLPVRASRTIRIFFITIMRSHKNPQYPPSKYPTQLAKMSFDEILAPTADVFSLHTRVILIPVPGMTL